MTRQPVFDPLPDSASIAIDDWAAFRIQHGLIVDQVIQGENAETWLFCHVAGERRSMSDQAPKSKLGLLLYTMLRAAADKPGVPQRRTLAGGLRIDMIIGLDGMTRLQLSREKVYPSDTEMATTLTAWPYPLGDLAPKKFDYHGRFYAQFAWPTPEMENNV